MYLDREARVGLLSPVNHEVEAAEEIAGGLLPVNERNGIDRVAEKEVADQDHDQEIAKRHLVLTNVHTVVRPAETEAPVLSVIRNLVIKDQDHDHAVETVLVRINLNPGIVLSRSRILFEILYACI